MKPVCIARHSGLKVPATTTNVEKYVRKNACLFIFVGEKRTLAKLAGSTQTGNPTMRVHHLHHVNHPPTATSNQRTGSCWKWKLQQRGIAKNKIYCEEHCSSMPQS